MFKRPLAFSCLWRKSSGEGRSRVGVVGRPAGDKSNCCGPSRKDNLSPKGAGLFSKELQEAPCPQHFCGPQHIPSPYILSHAGHVKPKIFPSSLLFPLSLTLASCNKQPVPVPLHFSSLHTHLSFSLLLLSESLCLKSPHLPLLSSLYHLDTIASLKPFSSRLILSGC